MKWDSGPPLKIKEIFEKAPLDKFSKKEFRTEWGPMYYRGRLDGSAKVLIVGQDPSANENISRRILVGAAGQLVQGLLAKIGITKSYVMINSSLFSFRGKSLTKNKKETIFDQDVIKWRNSVLDALDTGNIQCVLAFGQVAHKVIQNWPNADKYKNENQIFNLTHPTADSAVTKNWNESLSKIAAKISKDSDGIVNLSPYDVKFKNTDYVPIPLRDFGFGAPLWMGTGSFATRDKSNAQIIKVKALSDVG